MFFKTSTTIHRSQTTNERDGLIKAMKAQNKSSDLRKVQKAFQTNKIILEKGDVVIVYKHKLGAW